jgi:bacteriocin-like protein
MAFQVLGSGFLTFFDKEEISVKELQQIIGTSIKKRNSRTPKRDKLQK